MDLELKNLYEGKKSIRKVFQKHERNIKSTLGEKNEENAILQVQNSKLGQDLYNIKKFKIKKIYI